MTDVTHKTTSLRRAKAEATLLARPSTVQAVRDGTVPKGDPMPVAKVAAVLAAKRTSDWIPYCHNIPVEAVGFEAELLEGRIIVRVEVASVARTGVEVEAMVAASAAALTLYDMLKPIDPGLEVASVRLLEKQGGKSDMPRPAPFLAQVVVASDRAHAGEYEDVSGRILEEGLLAEGASGVVRTVVPDEVQAIQDAVAAAVQAGRRLVLVAGGTGLGPRDVTPEAVGPLLERRLPGVEEAFRGYGNERGRMAMLGRSLAGTVGGSVVVCVPGSPAACRDALAALFPGVLHALDVMEGGAHGLV